jgi:hypothetical protein
VLNATCRDFPRYIPSLLYGCLWLLVSCHWVCGASNSNPADSDCVLLNDCDKRNQGTPEVRRTTLGIPVWEQSLVQPRTQGLLRSLVFHLHEPISSLFSIWHILLIQFQLNLSNHFWMIHLQHRQYSGQRKVKKGGPTFPEGAPEWWNCATC